MFYTEYRNHLKLVAAGEHQTMHGSQLVEFLQVLTIPYI